MNIDPNSWKQQQRSVREKWSKLTDDDMTSIAGSRDQLVAKIQKAYSCSREEADRQVRDFERGGMETAGAPGAGREQGREQKGSEQTRSQPGGMPQGGGMRSDRPDTSRGTQERAPEQTAE